MTSKGTMYYMSDKIHYVKTKNGLHSYYTYANDLEEAFEILEKRVEDDIDWSSLLVGEDAYQIIMQEHSRAAVQSNGKNLSSGFVHYIYKHTSQKSKNSHD